MPYKCCVYGCQVFLSFSQNQYRVNCKECGLRNIEYFRHGLPTYRHFEELILLFFLVHFCVLKKFRPVYFRFWFNAKFLLNDLQPYTRFGFFRLILPVSTVPSPSWPLQIFNVARPGDVAACPPSDRHALRPNSTPTRCLRRG
uniref:Uncharacterized protein n=1 Tax=Cacopsylla melanoneura TaxID=428564 RepID=A0A8D9BGV9_9HEMI